MRSSSEADLEHRGESGTPPRSLLWQLPAILILWLIFIEWPRAPTGYLDPSWQEALVDAWLTGRQFGRDVIFTFGPWAFLFSYFYLPGALTTKLVFEVVARLLEAVLIVRLSARLPALHRWAWLSMFALAGPIFFSDIGLVAVAAAIVSVCLLNARASGILVALTLIAFGFAVWIKFSLTIFFLVAMTVVIGSHVVAGRWRRAVAITLGFLAASAGWWLAAGQSFGNLGAYLAYSTELTAGYSTAMALVGAPRVVTIGLVVLACHAIWVTRLAMLRREPPERLITVLLIGATVALMWKHGFTRADGHSVIFFIFSLLMVPLLPLFPGGNRLGWRPLIIAPLAILGVWLAEPRIVTRAVPNVFQRLSQSVRWLPEPSVFESRFARGTSAMAKRWGFPRTSERVGTASIDLIGNEQGILFLNGLRYNPRPIPQSYAAFTESLQRKNQAFFYSSSAPQFVLVGLSLVDGRYAGQEDALTLADLPRLYQPVLEEREYVLLEKRIPAVTSAPVLTKVLERVVSLGQQLELPAPDARALWMEVDADLSLVGKLSAFIHRPPLLSMTVTDAEGVATAHKLVPTIARSGLLIHPILRDYIDLVAFVRGQVNRTARAVRIDLTDGYASYWRPFRVTVSRIDNLPLTPFDLPQYLVDRGLVSDRPASLQSGIPPRPMVIDGSPVLFLHAPGEMVVPVAVGTRRVILDFGMHEAAYTSGGTTDGVEFGVELVGPDGRAMPLFRRMLEPLTHAADHGIQHAVVELPAGASGSIRLWTRPGPAGNANWDWSYVASLRLER